MDDQTKKRLAELEAATAAAKTKRTRKTRKPFKSRFAQIPLYWVEQLERINSAAVHRLALRILLEDHKRKEVGGEIILSSEVTKLYCRQTRAWAIRKMVKTEMIKVSQRGNRAVRVTELLHMEGPDPAERVT
jgi:hypothetical protein